MFWKICSCLTKTLISDSKSSYNKTPEPIVALTPILTPGLKLELIPVFTESPTIAPYLRLPVSVFLFLMVVFTVLLSKRKLAIFVPAAILQLEPKMESPT